MNDLAVLLLSNLPTLIIGFASLFGLAAIVANRTVRDISNERVIDDSKVTIVARHNEFNAAIGGAIINGLALLAAATIQDSFRACLPVMALLVSGLAFTGAWLWFTWEAGQNAIHCRSVLYRKFVYGVPLIMALLKLCIDRTDWIARELTTLPLLSMTLRSTYRALEILLSPLASAC